MYTLFQCSLNCAIAKVSSILKLGASGATENNSVWQVHRPCRRSSCQMLPCCVKCSGDRQSQAGDRSIADAAEQLAASFCRLASLSATGESGEVGSTPALHTLVPPIVSTWCMTMRRSPQQCPGVHKIVSTTGFTSRACSCVCGTAGKSWGNN